MTTRDQLSQLSEAKLHEVLEEKKQILERNQAKNRRVQSLLKRKIAQRQEIVSDLQTKINEKLSGNPDLKYLLNSHDFDKKAEELRRNIVSFRNMIIELENHKKNLARQATILRETVDILNSRQKTLQADIEAQKGEVESLSTADSNHDEGYDLTQISREYDEINEKMKILDENIGELKKQIHGGS
ncbi:MAG: hypothetical protein ACFFE8_08530 [Candidatus Heimdallarchaeota archaeon]